jgi:hypothetical protein
VSNSYRALKLLTCLPAISPSFLFVPSKMCTLYSLLTLYTVGNVCVVLCARSCEDTILLPFSAGPSSPPTMGILIDRAGVVRVLWRVEMNVHKTYAWLPTQNNKAPSSCICKVLSSLCNCMFMRLIGVDLWVVHIIYGFNHYLSICHYVTRILCVHPIYESSWCFRATHRFVLDDLWF